VISFLFFVAWLKCSFHDFSSKNLFILGNFKNIDGYIYIVKLFFQLCLSLILKKLCFLKKCFFKHFSLDISVAVYYIACAVRSPVVDNLWTTLLDPAVPLHSFCLPHLLARLQATAFIN